MLGVACAVYAGFGYYFPKWYQLFRVVGGVSLVVTMVISYFILEGFKTISANIFFLN